MTAPMHTSRDAASSDVPKRNHKGLPISEKVKVLDLMRRGTKSCTKFAKIPSRMNLLSMKLWRRKNKLILFLWLHHKLHKVMATLHDKCLVKMEKALNLWIEDMSTKHILIAGNVLHQKAVSLHKDVSERPHSHNVYYSKLS